MGGLLVKALLAALVNERVVDRLLAIVDHAVARRNEQQTMELSAEVERLHRANLERFDNLEGGLGRLGIRVRVIERFLWPEEDDPDGPHPEEEAIP